MLASLLDLNDNQLAALYGVFAWADQQGLLLLDLKDLQALLDWLLRAPEELATVSGGISPASIQAIQRRLVILQQQGAERLFGEPALQLADLMQRDLAGRAHIHLLEAGKLIQESPRVYASFLLWLLSELHEQLPEQGDADRPRLVLFFDEAHLLFDRTPKVLHERIEQVVRLIRSKGVGVFFVTQSPSDLPDAVLAQLGLRIQHALRAYTPREQKALKAVADGFRSNPASIPGGTDGAGGGRGPGQRTDEKAALMLSVPCSSALTHWCPERVGTQPCSRPRRWQGATSVALTANPPTRFSPSAPSIRRSRHRPKLKVEPGKRQRPATAARVHPVGA